ncbi:MAG: hydrolase, partial [Planctomycetota bacterium]
VYVAVDAVASRHAIDHDTALRRLDSAGVTLTTTEAALCEWVDAAGTPSFKAVSALLKEPGPENA